MTEKEINQLADMVAARVAEHPVMCRAFSPEEILHLKGFIRFCERSRTTALATTVGFLVIGTIGMIGLGIIQWVRARL
jgi:hypothetical protein